jgi:hypothetical protein
VIDLAPAAARDEFADLEAGDLVPGLEKRPRGSALHPSRLKLLGYGFVEEPTDAPMSIQEAPHLEHDIVISSGQLLQFGCLQRPW